MVPATDGSAYADSSINESEAVNLQIAQEASQSTQEEPPVDEPLDTAPAGVEMEAHAATNTDIDMEEVLADGGVRASHGSPNANAAGEDAQRGPESEKSAMQKILDALKGGLSELRAAALSRDEVNQVEDLFMDIKRELYGAEFRGRN